MDHYRTLNVSRDADPDVIDKAYRVLARKHHPDVASPAERTKANAKMQRINEAYCVLSDPRTRRAYDATLPPGEQGVSAWETFLSKGLIGMFLDR